MMKMRKNPAFQQLFRPKNISNLNPKTQGLNLDHFANVNMDCHVSENGIADVQSEIAILTLGTI